MGADLYIKQISDKQEAAWKPMFDKAVALRDSLPKGSGAADSAQELVSEAYDKMYDHEGYFRDSYNGSSVLWTLGLSWWQDCMPLLENGELRGMNLVKWRDMVAEATQTLPTASDLKEKGCAVTKSGEDSVEGWAEYYTDKRQRLIDFLDRAIHMEQPVDCSL